MRFQLQINMGNRQETVRMTTPRNTKPHLPQLAKTPTTIPEKADQHRII